MAHPWELTLEQFLEKLRHDYGIELRFSETRSVGPFGIIRFRYVVGADGAHFAILPDIEPDEMLPLDVIESLVRHLGLPREDFHLDPDPEG